MKKLKIITLSLSLLYCQTNLPNLFFKQVAISAIAGAATAGLLKENRDPGIPAFLIISSYTGMKFSYDTLSGEAGFLKGSFSIPLNFGTAAISFIVCSLALQGRL